MKMRVRFLSLAKPPERKKDQFWLRAPAVCFVWLACSAVGLGKAEHQYRGAKVVQNHPPRGA